MEQALTDAKYVWTERIRKLLPARPHDLVSVIEDVKYINSSVLQQIHGAAASLYSTDYTHSVSLSQILLDKIWEELNTGYWKDVRLCWRQAYSVVSVIKAVALTALFSEASVTSDHVAVLKTCDMGLLMGSPVLNNILARMSAEFQQVFGIVRPGRIMCRSQTADAEVVIKYQDEYNSDTLGDIPSKKAKLTHDVSGCRHVTNCSEYCDRTVSRTEQLCTDRTVSRTEQLCTDRTVSRTEQLCTDRTVSRTEQLCTDRTVSRTEQLCTDRTVSRTEQLCSDAVIQLKEQVVEAQARDSSMHCLSETSQEEPVALPPRIQLQLIEDIRQCSCPSVQMFHTAFFNLGRPVVITNAIDYWPALTTRRWSVDYLRSVAGFRTVPVEIGTRYTEDSWTQKLMTVNELIDTYITAPRASTKAYLAQHQLFDQVWELKDDISVPVYCCLGQEEDVDINAWFGPAGTVSPLHQDPKHNFLCQVMGKKYVRLYSHEHTDSIYPHPTRLLHNTSQIDLDSPDLSQFPKFASTPGLEYVLNPGDMLYIPPGYWHYLKSLSVSFSVSFWWQ